MNPAGGSGCQATWRSDHGNLEAVGCGRPLKGTLAELRGQRVCVYDDERLREAGQTQFPDAFPWPSFGLPGGYLPLLAPGRTAFVAPGERVVAHGGVSLEELIVPWVEVDQSAT